MSNDDIIKCHFEWLFQVINLIWQVKKVDPWETKVENAAVQISFINHKPYVPMSEVPIGEYFFF